MPSLMRKRKHLGSSSLIRDDRKTCNGSLIETEILLSLRPILESWSGQKLSKDHVVHGIRRYLRGAYFMSHVDRLPSHIISSIGSNLKIPNLEPSEPPKIEPRTYRTSNLLLEIEPRTYRTS